jgi:WD40 repeat protein
VGAGRAPFQSDTPLGYLRKHLQDAPPPFRTVKSDLPELPEVENVVMKALAKDRDRRYGSVLEFAREYVQAAQAVGLRNGALLELGAQGGLPGSPSAAISPFVLECTLTGNTYGVTSVTFSPNAMLLASTGYDYTVKIWDVCSLMLRRALEGHSGYVYCVAFSPYGKLLASGSQDKTIKLWDVASGTLVRTLAGHREVVASVAFSPNGELLASGSLDDTIKLWRVAK